MEFKQLTIEKFLSYYPKTVFDFSSTTIILGQNNTGKSKLFDAINFVLYERVYDTQKEQWILDTNQISELILNKFAVKKGIESRDEILKNYVELVIEDGIDIIKIKRVYSYNQNDNKYQLASCQLEISVLNQINSKNIEFYKNQEAKDYLSRKFSTSIKDFFLFQGESASKILKLQKNSSFVNAVREIARLGLFEKAVEIAQRFNNSAQLRITKQLKKNKLKQEEIEILNRTIENTVKEVEELERERNASLTLKNEYQDKKVVLKRNFKNTLNLKHILKTKKK